MLQGHLKDYQALGVWDGPKEFLWTGLGSPWDKAWDGATWDRNWVRKSSVMSLPCWPALQATLVWSTTGTHRTDCFRVLDRLFHYMLNGLYSSVLFFKFVVVVCYCFGTAEAPLLTFVLDIFDVPPWLSLKAKQPLRDWHTSLWKQDVISWK